MIFNKIQEFSKNSQGRSLKARGLIFWILALDIRIEAPVKTEFAKSIKMVDFRGMIITAPLGITCFENTSG